MAKNARFYEVERQNGHKQWVEIIAAQSKSHIQNALNTEHIKVNMVRSLGWAPVKARPDEFESQPEFHAVVNNKELVISPELIGYKYLAQQFQDQVQEVNAWIDQQRRSGEESG